MHTLHLLIYRPTATSEGSGKEGYERMLVYVHVLTTSDIGVAFFILQHRGDNLFTFVISPNARPAPIPHTSSTALVTLTPFTPHTPLYTQANIKHTQSIYGNIMVYPIATHNTDGYITTN